MKRLIATPTLAAIALTLGAFAAASSAQARSDVNFSVGVQVPGVYVQPAPVYEQPRQIYRPMPSRYERYDEGRRYEGPHWQHRGPYGNHEREGFANVYESGGPRHQWYPSHPYGPTATLTATSFPTSLTVRRAIRTAGRLLGLWGGWSPPRHEWSGKLKL
ncbi:hypothetical protein MIZ03_1500 [Rhodoferax lithotrophicus]|uniref:Uncharacterized protein n=1 Tax=Rhodoferax lithotrophicus TaxID=2798804 RepID=A0ABN6D3N3_9BURK|nr:hypothetical protein [Rhodoferax sp. MIZ03]BCO26617.1 hypothetical protein MIZ03_1500 [Rhodoferax sp. MIZ03]